MPKLSTPQKQSRERRTKLAMDEWRHHRDRYTSEAHCARTHGIQQVTLNRRLRQLHQSPTDA
jgi:hypothetical protein